MSMSNKGEDTNKKQPSGWRSAIGKFLGSKDGTSNFLRGTQTTAKSPPAPPAAKTTTTTEMGSQSAAATANLPQDQAEPQLKTAVTTKPSEATDIASFMKRYETTAATSSKPGERQFTTMLDTLKSVSSVGSIGSLGDMDDLAFAAFEKSIGKPKGDSTETSTSASAASANAKPSPPPAQDAEERRIQDAALKIVQYMKSSEAEKKEMDHAAMIAHILKTSESTKQVAGAPPNDRQQQPMNEEMAHIMRSAESTVQQPQTDSVGQYKMDNAPAAAAAGDVAAQKNIDAAALIAHFSRSAGSQLSVDRGAAPPVEPPLVNTTMPAATVAKPAPKDSQATASTATQQTAASDTMPKPNTNEEAMIAQFMKSTGSSKKITESSLGDGQLTAYFKDAGRSVGDVSPDTVFKSTEITTEDLHQAAMIARIMKTSESMANAGKPASGQSQNPSVSMTPTFDEFIQRLRSRKKDLEEAAALADHLKNAASTLQAANGDDTPGAIVDMEEAALIAQFMKSADGYKSWQAPQLNLPSAPVPAPRPAAAAAEEPNFVSAFMKSCESEAGKAAFLNMIKSGDHSNSDTNEAAQSANAMKSADFSNLMMKSADFSKKGTGADTAFISNFMENVKASEASSAPASDNTTGNASISNFMKSIESLKAQGPAKSAEFLKSAEGSMFLSAQFSNIFNSQDWMPRSVEKEIDNNLVSSFLRSQTSQEVMNFLGRTGSIGAAATPQARPGQVPGWSYHPGMPPPPVATAPPRQPGTDWQKLYESRLPSVNGQQHTQQMPRLPAIYYQPSPAEEAAVALASITPRQHAEQAARAREFKTRKLPTMTKRRRPRKQHEPQEKVFVEVRDEDVLFGRGGRTNHHVGNKRYLAAKDEVQKRYMVADKNEKTAISQELVDMVKNWGGRFLKLEKGTEDKWYEVMNIVARKKASQSLREVNTPEERAAKRARYADPKQH